MYMYISMVVRAVYALASLIASRNSSANAVYNAKTDDR